jgi:hypothetical protein
MSAHTPVEISTVPGMEGIDEFAALAPVNTNASKPALAAETLSIAA